MAPHFRSVVLASVLLACLPALADVQPASVFGDHMMLQRDLPVPVWGTAAAGESVTVRFAGKEKTATADQFGSWLVRLDALPANAEAQTMEIVGKNTITFTDVLVGDVWICSGQSNMEWSINGSMNRDAEAASADFPAIRLFNVPRHISSPNPLSHVPGDWQVCTPATVRHFSAVGYFFGRRLHKETGVPIGLIGTNWGGTAIEPWTPPVGFRAVPELKQLADALATVDPATPQGKETWETYLNQVESWTPAARNALADGRSMPSPPAPPKPPPQARNAAGIYNGMVHGLAPYGICGAIWYQGESNGGEGESYYHKMKALINGWRTVWGQGDFPFYFVQLANFRNPTESPAGGDGWARLREAQRKTLTVPNTGMAVIIDIGEAGDIHPRNKQDVGWRLAQWALHQTYGKEKLVPSGPLYKSHATEGSTIRIAFDHVGAGLIVGEKEGLEPVEALLDGELKGFAVAGKDKTWVWAEAAIDGDTVVLSSPAVPEPVAVRYAYSMNPEGANLYNADGMPASPFRTDDW